MKTAVARILAIIAFSTALSLSAYAEDTAPDFKSEKLTGDWGGVRQSLYDKGLDISVYYKVDFWSNFSGGIKRESKWLDNLDVKLALDAEKAMGWKGASFLLYFLNNNGQRINDAVGSSAGIDNIETSVRDYKIHEAFLQQNLFDDRLSLLGGLYDVNTEFYVTDTSGIFINPTYGIGTEAAATGDNGPSIFPNTSLAARIAVKPSKDVYVQAALMDGVPGDPNHMHSTHIRFKDKDGAYVIGEIGYKNEANGHYAVGAWDYTARRPDVQTPAAMKHSKGTYFLAERSLYNNSGKDISAFARFGLTAGNVEQFKHSWSGGVVFSGFVPSRENGKIGFGVSNAANSSKYKVANAPVDSSETQIELTYQDTIGGYVTVQPDFQYTINPGTDPTLKNSFVGGIRFGIDF